METVCAENLLLALNFLLLYNKYKIKVIVFFRCLIMEMASCLVEGANDNLIEIIYNLTIHSFQVFFEV